MFTTIFSHINSVEELRNCANELCQQIKAAHDARMAELVPASKSVRVEAKKPESKKAEKVTKAEVKTTTKKAVKAEKKEDVQISISDKSAIKKLGLTFARYSDKSYLLTGDTKPICKDLSKLKGKFSSSFKASDGGKIAGWIFSVDNAKEAAKKLSLKLVEN